MRWVSWGQDDKHSFLPAWTPQSCSFQWKGPSHCNLCHGKWWLFLILVLSLEHSKQINWTVWKIDQQMLPSRKASSCLFLSSQKYHHLSDQKDALKWQWSSSVARHTHTRAQKELLDGTAEEATLELASAPRPHLTVAPPCLPCWDHCSFLLGTGWVGIFFNLYCHCLGSDTNAVLDADVNVTWAKFAALTGFTALW